MDEIKKQRDMCKECTCVDQCKVDLKENRIFYSGKKLNSCVVVDKNKKAICNELEKLEVKKTR